MGQYAGFSRVKLRKPQRSKFDLSHEKKLSARMGKLVPIFVQETMPNDTFKVNSEIMLRLAPLVSPIYHRVNVFVHFFFVPMRLLYKDWEKFITNGRLGTEVPPVPPWVNMGSAGGGADDPVSDGVFAVSQLADYLGCPPIPDTDFAAWNNKRMSPLPFHAYYRCWYDYYRDRNYREDNWIGEPLPSGEMSYGAFGVNFSSIAFLRSRAWQHDYFTSALPWTQRGNEVLMPVELSNPNITLKSTAVTLPGGHAGALKVDAVGQLQANDNTFLGVSNIDNIEFSNTSVSINDLRQAVRLQEWLERNAVAGSRYNESIMAHFARRTSDGRLQRAEYLGGGRVAVQISEVMTTAFSEDAAAETIPPATPSGRGVAYGKQNRFRYNCEEHGFILGIMSVMPVSGYMQGFPRMFFERRTFLDYPWPSFANLGEQEVYKYEIYGEAANVPTGNAEPAIFGYQSRYADWKYVSGSVHGDFRTSLDHWHLNRKFAFSPSLNEAFVTFEDALQNRVFAVSDVDTLWCYIHNNCTVVRSLPYFGTPTLA